LNITPTLRIWSRDKIVDFRFGSGSEDIWTVSPVVLQSGSFHNWCSLQQDSQLSWFFWAYILIYPSLLLKKWQFKLFFRWIQLHLKNKRRILKPCTRICGTVLKCITQLGDKFALEPFVDLNLWHWCGFNTALNKIPVSASLREILLSMRKPLTNQSLAQVTPPLIIAVRDSSRQSLLLRESKTTNQFWN